MRLQAAIQEFVGYKRALGASYKGENNRLVAFLRFAGDLQLKSLTKRHVDSYLPVPGDKIVTSGWFKKYETLSRFIQFAIGRGYMRHRILPDLLPEKPPAFVPYIYSLGDMRNLLGVPDSHYSPLCPLIPYTMRVFLVLLYGTGLRLGEAIKLNIQDVDLDTAVITVRDTKFFKSRLVPVGGDLLRILHQYRTRQISTTLQLPDAPFFRTRLGKPVRHDNADHQFQWLRMEAGVLRFDNARFQPRLHDFRHTFAVTRLTSWYREGKNVQRLLPHLSTYLGHVSIEETATYLRMTAELLNEANARFESYSLGEGYHA
jgi:integrase/recombinase XerD